MTDKIRARRVTGGAVVTVIRADGRVHRHRVGLRRYNRLLDTLVAHRGMGACLFAAQGFECSLREVGGLVDARRRASRGGGHRAKYWRDAA